MLIIGVCGKAGSGKDTIADILVRDHGFVKVAFADPLKRICKDIFGFSDEQLWGPSTKRNEPDYRYPRENPCFWERSAGSEPFTCKFCGDKEASAEQLAVKRCNAPDRAFLTPRHALQKLGTEWGRDCYPDIWVEYAMRVAKQLAQNGWVYDAKSGLRFSDRLARNIETVPKGVVISDVRFRNEVEGLKRAGAKVVRVHRGAMKGLSGAAGQHRSETEQDNLPDELFDFILNNDGSLEDLVVTAQSLGTRFRIEERDEGFAEMLKGIGEEETSGIVKHGAETAVVAGEEFSMSLGAIKAGEVDVIPANETPAQARLRGMLEDRERDVAAGKILPFDGSQKDIPPFKRKKNP